jgi:hypothetical protein
MAIVKKGKLTVGFWMSDTNPKSKTNKISSITLNVLAAAVTSYNGAADDAARAATTIGTLIDTYTALTTGVLEHVDAGFTYEQASVAPAPDQPAFASDKFLVQSRDNVNAEANKSSIPARDMADVVMESDGDTVTLADGADVAAFVTAYEAIVLSQDLNPLTVRMISVAE